MANNLQDIFKQNPYELKQASRRSISWFQQQALLLGKQKITPNKVLKSDASKLKNQIMPGSMYMFFYDPKHKETLPYYDRFPLVLPFEKTEDGFIGLNLHYIPYQQRTILLQRLMQFASNTKLNETTRLKYSWDLIRGASKFRWAEPCVKRYLNAHLRSSLRKIDASDWATAILLPVESFVGSSKAAVWAESMRGIL